MDGVKELVEKGRAGFLGIAQVKVCMIVVLLYHTLIFALFSSLVPKSSQALVETPHHGNDDEDELDLEEGNVVTVLLKRDSHWWIGKLKEKKGLFPANNVKEIKGIVVHVVVIIIS